MKKMDDCPRLRERQRFCVILLGRERERSKNHRRRDTPGGICDCEMHRSTVLSTARCAALRSYSRDASFISCQGHKASVHSCLAQEPPQKDETQLTNGG